MRAWAALAALVAVMAVSGAAHGTSAERRFCGALDDLARAARRTGQEQKVGIYAGPLADDDGLITTCSFQTGVAVQSAFCTAAAPVVGFEFKHRFPWLVDRCLRRWNVMPRKELADGGPAFGIEKRIVHLSADVARTHLDLRYALEEGATNIANGTYHLAMTPR